MSDEQSPMSDADLARACAYVDHHESYGGLSVGNLSMLRQLLSEIHRLKRELWGRRNLGVKHEQLRVEGIQLREEIARAESRAAAVVADRLEQLAKDVVDQFYSPAGTDAEHIITYLRREALAERGRVAALDGSGMPCPLAEEAQEPAIAPDTAMDPFEAADDIDRRWE